MIEGLIGAYFGEGRRRGGSVLAHQEKRASRLGVIGAAQFARELPHGSGNGLEVLGPRIRETDRSHASGPPSLSEGRKPERLDQTKNLDRRRTHYEQNKIRADSTTRD